MRLWVCSSSAYRSLHHIRLMFQCTNDIDSPGGPKFSYPDLTLSRRAHMLLRARRRLRSTHGCLLRQQRRVVWTLDSSYCSTLAEASASLASKHHLPFNSEARILANNQKVLEKQLTDPASVFSPQLPPRRARAASFLRLEATELAKLSCTGRSPNAGRRQRRRRSAATGRQTSQRKLSEPGLSLFEHTMWYW